MVQARLILLNDVVDCFARISHKLHYELGHMNQIETDVFDYVLLVNIQEEIHRQEFLWPIKADLPPIEAENHLNAIYIGHNYAKSLRLKGGIKLDIALGHAKSRIPEIVKLEVEPLDWVNQVMASEYAELLASGAVLENVKLAWLGSVFSVTLGKFTLVQLKVRNIDGNLKLGKITDGTELHISQPFKDPKSKDVVKHCSTVPESICYLSLIADDDVIAGKAVFSIHDFIKFAWKPINNLVFLNVLVVRPFKLLTPMRKPASTQNQATIVASALSKQKVPEGVLLVNPGLLDFLTIPNGVQVRVSVIEKLVDLDADPVHVTVTVKPKVEYFNAQNKLDALLDSFANGDKIQIPKVVVDRFLNVRIDTSFPHEIVCVNRNRAFKTEYLFDNNRNFDQPLNETYTAPPKLICEIDNFFKVSTKNQAGILLMHAEKGPNQAALIDFLVRRKKIWFINIGSLLKTISPSESQSFFEELKEELEFVSESMRLAFNQVDDILSEPLHVYQVQANPCVI